MFGFKDTNIYVEGEGIIKTNLQIEQGRFVSFEKKDELIKLPSNLIIVPGLIDEHMHGANGSDVMDGEYSSLDNIAVSILQDGVTSFLPTTMTMEKEKIFKALDNISNYMKKDNRGSQVLGVHLEGPFISKKYCGAQDPQFIKKPTLKNIEKYINSYPNLISIITLAYEECDDGIVSYLKDKGIIISIGHSDCSGDLLKKGISEGISLSTHTFNAMRGIHHRDIGIPGTIMLNNSVNAELICDLHHVCSDAIRLLYKTKGKDSIILITDSMEARFLKDGIYHLGGQEVYVNNGFATLKNNILAGSTLRMNKAIKNIKGILNLSLEDSIDMASINPARNLKIDNYKGSIAKNKDADFVIIDKELNVYATYVKGELRYKK